MVWLWNLVPPPSEQNTDSTCSGWLDLVVVKYSHAINHYTALNLTKLDILDTFPVIKVAVAYKDPRTGEEIPSFPADQKLVESAEVVVSTPELLTSRTALARMACKIFVAAEKS